MKTTHGLLAAPLDGLGSSVRNSGRTGGETHPEDASIPTGGAVNPRRRIGRGRSRIRQGEVARATRGLLSAVSSAGLKGNIEVHLESGVVTFRMTTDPGMPTIADETSADIRKLL
jgi:hypothetical protein